MTVDEFLLWEEDNPGRYDLLNGVAYGVPLERVGHVRAKARVHRALEAAVARSGLACEAMADGMLVRIDADTAYESDALVYCGEPLPDDAIEVPAPVVVVEVMSPGTRTIDTAIKLGGYFAVPSIQHYLMVDPVGRALLHHRRNGEAIFTRVLRPGAALRLDPPGLDVAVDDVLGRG